MKITSASGLISGTFTRDEGGKASVIFQKGTDAGGYGYFLSNQPKPLDYAGESGGVEILAK